MNIECPHCNATKGFYIKQRVTGTATTYFTANGDYAAEQSEMYSLSHKGGIRAYCSSCHKIMGNSENLISGKEEEKIAYR